MYTPTETESRFYEEFGYLVTPKVLDLSLLEDAVFGTNRLYSGDRDFSLPISGGYLDWRAEHGDRLRINDYVSLQIKEIRNLVLDPLIGRVAASLSRSRQIRLFHDQLIGKPPGIGNDGAVGWHVDKAYWKTCTSETMLTAWIPLSRQSAESGPLTVLEGSHRWQGTDGLATFNERDLETLETRLSAPGRTVRKVALTLEPGQISFHHCRTVHGSAPNLTKEMRLALTVHLQDGENEYRARQDDRGRTIVHMNDVLCRRLPDGRPDYADPEICPALWPPSPA